MRFKIEVIIALLVFSIQNSYGALPTYRYSDHIGIEEGLSNNTITTIVQDSLGVMWIGTHAGLNSYDGSHIRVYESRSDEDNSLPESRIMQLIADGMTLYIKTINHVTIFDIVQEKFTSIDVPNILAMDVYDDLLYVATQSEVFVVDVVTGEFSKLNVAFELFDQSSSIKVIKRSGELLYVGTNQGLLLYNMLTSSTSVLVKDVAVSNLYIDKSEKLWLSTMANGAYLLEDNRVVQHFSTPAISHNFVRDFQEDNDGNIWMGTMKGLHKLSSVENATNTYDIETYDVSQFTHNSVWDIFCDRDGMLWIGTYFGGVNTLNPAISLFSHFSVDDDVIENQLVNIVGAIDEDAEGNLYLATHGGGLSYLNVTTGEYINYQHLDSDPRSIGCNNILDIYIHKKNEIILATNTDGVNIFDIKSRKFTSLSGSKSAVESGIGRSVSHIEPYVRNSYLISGHRGIFIFDMDDLSFKPLVSETKNDFIHNKIAVTKYTSTGEIWLGAETQGLARYNPSTGEFSYYRSGAQSNGALPSNEINAIYEDQKSRIWVSTLSGLSLYQPETDDFKTYTTSQGLPSNTVYEICDSRFQEIIITTPVGISILSEASGAVRSFTANNGMPLSPIKLNSLLYSRSGTIYIGGHNGIMSLTERDILNRDTPKNKIAVTSIKAMGRYLRANAGIRVLSKNILFSDKVVLPHDQNSVDFDFTDFEMRVTNRAELEYKLEGFDDHFIAANGRNSASYTNLPYRKYRFVVRYADAASDELDYALDLVVRPPFYLSLVAFILYVIGALTAMITITRLHYQRRIALAMLSIEQRDRERDQEYNESKLRFFTNISHELRTPLTLISGQLEHIIDDSSLDPAPYNRVLQSYKSVEKLQSLVDELLDLRKQQNGFATFDIKSCDVRELLHEVYVNYIELAADRNLTYTLNVDGGDQIYAQCDHEAIEKVFFNLLSNAFKFTHKGGVDVSMRQLENHVEIVVSDSGEGIDKSSLSHIFERFYQEGERRDARDGAPRGSGIGLALVKGIVDAHEGKITVESKKGVGSSFVVQLPLAHKQQEESANEIAPDPQNESLRNSVIDSSEVVDEIIAKLKSQGVDKDKLILVVEDNAAMQEFLYDILSAHYQVEVANDGVEGYAKAVELLPSLILSDVMMPNMTGTQMCAQIKENILTSHIPVVLLTAKVALEHKIEGLEMGADDYIKKPFSVRLLVARIANILESRRRLEERLFSRMDGVVEEQVDAPSEVLSPEAEADAEFITKALRVVEENIANESYSVDQFAADMFMGRTNFFKKLNRLVGMTPNEVILSVRLKHSVELLSKGGGLSIGEISDMCGFNTQQYFSRCFKRKFGCTPAQYLKRGDAAK